MAVNARVIGPAFLLAQGVDERPEVVGAYLPDVGDTSEKVVEVPYRLSHRLDGFRAKSLGLRGGAVFC